MFLSLISEEMVINLAYGRRSRLNLWMQIKLVGLPRKWFRDDATRQREEQRKQKIKGWRGGIEKRSKDAPILTGFDRVAWRKNSV